MHRRLFLAALLLAALPVSALSAGTITIAVASNFARTAEALAAAFSADTGIPVRLSFGSTGKLYAQAINGAPYDVLLAADVERPRRLEASGHGVRNSRFTYAIGALVLWSRDTRAAGRDCRQVLESGDYEHLALANPEIAPYGRAARDVLVALGLDEAASGRLVLGENIAQTLQFVATGNATLGFIAQSQLGAETLPTATCAWTVPSALHEAIEQQVIVLEESVDAMRFADFLRSPAARAIITGDGYRVPGS